MANRKLGEDIGDLPEELAFEEKFHGGGNQGGGGRGRGKGGRGGKSGGGGGNPQNKKMQISKALSKLLRHAAADAGLKLDSEGYGRLDQVMKWPRLASLKVTFADIQDVVSDNEKQRFSIKPNPALKSPPDPKSEDPSDWVIRANQGHSIAIESAALLVPITLEAGNVPEIVVHGTYFAFYQAIIESGGLKKMGRNHIHMSTGLPEDKQCVISGMRKDAEVLIYVDIQESLKDGGVLWWISDNGVVLTEGDENGVLSTKYFKKVVGMKLDVGTLWEDGEKIAELPESARKTRPPQGKGAASGAGRGNRRQGKK
ncbi:tRNA 2'-phosphotransferase [Lachnellula willkommii]|uniref:2'-phosphotransferase n=1 Tax=Lachnellula willkommii TaxID=215461 RepID=A0A559MGZ8_9HELO|nr:tRNA 2'-phosphotransferase [Lachnellula willkommii]